MKAIRYKNHTELFVLNGNKKPIRYEFYNGVKLNRYNGNMVYISKSERCYNTKTLAHYFHVKKEISVDFHVCISAPLMVKNL